MVQGMHRPSRRLTLAGIVLGLSLGGFFDGILLHQVLQWHHMLTSVEDPAIRNDLTLNMMADGFFHVATWLMAVLGLVLLWRARRDFGALTVRRGFVGPLLMGAGLFNLVEGTIDHHLLGVHHVRTGSPNELAWDLAFLAVGALLLGAGWWLQRAPVPQLPGAATPRSAKP